MSHEKNVFIVSLGCPKNLVDTEVMLGLLEKAGFAPCDDAEVADILLVNTCGFIQSAVEEGIDEILALAEVKEEFPGKLLVVAGCMVQRYGEQLASELPEVDLFIGTEGIQEIVTRLHGLIAGEHVPLELSLPTFLMDSTLPRRISTPAHRAYLKVTEGCANRCAYCLIPSIRGGLRSRTLPDLIQEAQRLEAQGVKELTLVAQDLTSYGYDHGPGGARLLGLLENLVQNTHIPWIRLLYLYPARVEEALLEFIAAHSRIVPYLDIPLQHTEDRILKAMNRPYGRRHIDSLLERIRRILPGAAIRTTFMVGFPGENPADIARLEEFMQEQRLDHVGIFSYSNEEGCAAFSMANQCSEIEKEERRERLLEVQAAISLAKNQARIGTVEEVLVEGISSETDLLLEGRGRFQAPDIDGCFYIAEGTCSQGDIVQVRITDAHPYDLIGEIVD